MVWWVGGYLLVAVLTWLVVTSDHWYDEVILAAIWPILWLWVAKETVQGRMKWKRKGRE